MIKDYLGNKFMIVATTTARQALLEFQRQDFDVVITDLVLSTGDDGVSLIRDLREKNPRVPVIAFSAFSFDPYLPALKKLGVAALLPKADAGELGEAILHAIEKAQEHTRATPKEPELLVQVRTLLLQEIDKYSQIKERTLNILGEGYFPLIKSLIGFKHDIQKQLSRFPYAKNVFLMMKFRSSNAELAEFIIESLRDHGLSGIRADHPEWNLTNIVYNPLAVLYCGKYGIALFDEPEPAQAYSANVAYELGMMHYQGKNCLILKHSSLPPVPFDLIKDLYVSYDRDLSVRKFISSWINQITK